MTFWPTVLAVALGAFLAGLGLVFLGWAEAKYRERRRARTFRG